jgi:hypothetical protein
MNSNCNYVCVTQSDEILKILIVKYLQQIPQSEAY